MPASRSRRSTSTRMPKESARSSNDRGRSRGDGAAAARCRLVVMHAAQGRGRAQSLELAPEEVWRHIQDFFAERIPRLERAGIARERLILDPGMGLFLSRRPESSLRVLRGLEELKRIFGLPILISVSRKSFLGRLTGHR